MKDKQAKQHEERTDIDRYRDLCDLVQVGWWEFNVMTKQYTCSEFIHDLLELKGAYFTYQDITGFVRKDYQELLKQKLFEFTGDNAHFSSTAFPLVTPRGETWVKTSIKKHVKENDTDIIFGILQVVPKHEIEKLSAEGNHFLIEANAISSAMDEVLLGKDENSIIHSLFTSILSFYNASDIFINEFTDDKKFQTCTYEVVDDSFELVMSRYNFFDNANIPWISSNILSNQSVVVDSLDQLPSEASHDILFLNSLHIYSFMTIPLYNEYGIWGYIGIDVKNHERKWSDEDYLLMLSMSHVAGICLSMARMKKMNETVQLQKDVLLEHIPVGYERLRLIRDRNRRIVDYQILESNLLASRILAAPWHVPGICGSGITDKSFFKDELSFLEEVSKRHIVECDKQVAPSRYCRKISYLLNSDEVVEMIIDTSETVNAYKSKHRSEKMFTDIFINIPVSEAIYDLNGRMTNMNESFMETFGLSSLEDVKGYSFLEDHNLTADLKQLILSNEKCAFRVDYDFDRVDNYKTRRKGIVPMNCKLVKLRGAEDEVIGFLFICIEDNDRFISMSRIHDFDDFFLLISDYAKVGYAKYDLITGKGYAIKQWFKNVEEDCNQSIGDIIGIYNTLHPDDKKKLLDFYNKVKKGKASEFTSEIRIRMSGKKDKWKWLYSSLLLTKYAPKEGQIELIGVNYDITNFKDVERKLTEAREKAEAMDKLKTAFLANMSHEIRTPLNAIVGFSDLIASTENAEERKQYMTILRENNHLLLQLINDILDLSKLEAGMVVMNNADVDIHGLLLDVTETMQLKMHDGVELVIVEDDGDGTIYSDRYRLTQIFTNFITNSIKFTSKGSITVGYNRLDNNRIKFYVSDTGIGISEEKKKDIFERFVKLNDFVQGTGLGLPICYSIVSQMGGVIGVDSKVGEGSTFWFILPDKKK